MTLPRRDPPPPQNGEGLPASNDSMGTVARVLAFLFATVLIYILYRVALGAWRQYQQHGAQSLVDRRRGTYRRIPSLRLQPPEEDIYKDDEVDGDAPVGERGKGRAMDVEVVIDEGYHDGEESLDMERPAAARNADLWKSLPERPLPDKPLPDVPR